MQLGEQTDSPDGTLFQAGGRVATTSPLLLLLLLPLGTGIVRNGLQAHHLERFNRETSTATGRLGPSETRKGRWWRTSSRV